MISVILYKAAGEQAGALTPGNAALLYWLMPILLLAIAGILYLMFRGKRAHREQPNVQRDVQPDNVFEVAGFIYDAEQDIFYSALDAWQRRYGYCKLYDEAAMSWGMVIDCEPLYFEYANKKWMIELWKGQYGMTTGGEIGVYTASGPDLNLKKFQGTFYQASDDANMLDMSFLLIKNGRVLFKREQRHWWLTGFLLGEFSQPNELTMIAEITLKDETMRDAFISALRNTGYSAYEYSVYDHMVRIVYAKPHAQQPSTRKPLLESWVQRRNKALCEAYRNTAQHISAATDKLAYLREQKPGLYRKIVKRADTQKLYASYHPIRPHIGEGE